MRIHTIVEPLVAPLPLSDVPLPYYYSVVLVRVDSPFQNILDLSGAVFGYNDEYSLSGFHCMKIFLKALSLQTAQHAVAAPFYSKQVRTGSHTNSIDALYDNTVDVIAMDCNVLARLEHEIAWQEKLSKLRILHIPDISLPLNEVGGDGNVTASGEQQRHICPVATDGRLGPHPSQPIVASRAVDEETKQLFKRALLSIDSSVVAHLGISGYHEVDERFYFKTKLLLDLVRHDRIAECSSLYTSPNDILFL